MNFPKYYLIDHPTFKFYLDILLKKNTCFVTKSWYRGNLVFQTTDLWFVELWRDIPLSSFCNN